MPKVNPYAWRLGQSSKPNVKFFTKLKNYPLYTKKVLEIENEALKLIPDLIRVEVSLKGESKFSITLTVPGLESVKKDELKILKKRLEKRHSLEIDNLKADFINRKEPNADWIAEEVKSSIIKRENPVRIINHFLKLVSNFSKITGLRICLKGRFRAKTKTQKSIYKYGQLRLQSIKTLLDYSERLIVGKYGTSTVKVVVGYS